MSLIIWQFNIVLKTIPNWNIFWSDVWRRTPAFVLFHRLQPEVQAGPRPRPTTTSASDRASSYSTPRPSRPTRSPSLSPTAPSFEVNGNILEQVYFLHTLHVLVIQIFNMKQLTSFKFNTNSLFNLINMKVIIIPLSWFDSHQTLIKPLCF